MHQRPILGFYDFVFMSIAFLCLSLALPVLPRWFEFTETRKWVVGASFCLGVVALFLLAKRPDALRDQFATRLDLYDFVLLGSIWFFANSTLRNFVRWGEWNMTKHKMLIVFTLGFITLLSIFCLFTRGSSDRLVFTFFFLSFMGLSDGVWKFTTGTTPKWLIPIPKEYAYGSFAFAGFFLLAWLIALGLKKRG